MNPKKPHIASLDVMKTELGNQEFNTKIEDELTMFGAACDERAWQFLALGWNDTTAKTYLQDFIDLVFPQFNNVSLNSCSREDLDEALKKMAFMKSKYKFKFRHMQYILGKLVKSASEVGICKNFVWGTKYILPEAKNDRREDIKGLFVTYPKSLTIREELETYKEIMTDQEQSGDRFGLALMFCLGLRENEACQLDFQDIKPFKCDPSKYCAWIYKTSEKNTRENKIGGKTINTPRIIPIPDKLQILINARICYLKNQNGVNKSHMERWPIACSKSDYRIPCKPTELSFAGTQLLKNIKMNEHFMALLDDNLDFISKESPGIIEKDPTTYLFRRNLATHLYILGLSESEIQYILGHDIEDPEDARNLYRNEEKLYKISQKMRRRPLVNDICDKQNILSDHIDLYNVDELKIKVPCDENIRIRLSQLEPNSTTVIDGTKKLSGKGFSYENNEPYSENTNVISIYHSRYELYESNKESYSKEATDNID